MHDLLNKDFLSNFWNTFELTIGVNISKKYFLMWHIYSGVQIDRNGIKNLNSILVFYENTLIFFIK